MLSSRTGSTRHLSLQQRNHSRSNGGFKHRLPVKLKKRLKLQELKIFFSGFLNLWSFFSHLCFDAKKHYFRLVWFNSTRYKFLTWFENVLQILVNQQFNDEIDIIITPSPDSPTDDESSMTPRDPLRPASSASSDLCQCSSRHSNSSVHCAACGRPLKSGPSSPRTDRKKQATFLAKHSVSVATPSPARKVSLNRDTIRMNVVNEIINSEKVYVGHLKDVIEVSSATLCPYSVKTCYGQFCLNLACNRCILWTV